MLQMDENYLTLDEVAEKLKVSRRSVSRMIESGALPAIRLFHERGSVRIVESDLRRYLEERRTRPSEAPEED